MANRETGHPASLLLPEWLAAIRQSDPGFSPEVLVGMLGAGCWTPTVDPRRKVVMWPPDAVVLARLRLQGFRLRKGECEAWESERSTPPPVVFRERGAGPRHERTSRSLFWWVSDGWRPPYTAPSTRGVMRVRIASDGLGLSESEWQPCLGGVAAIRRAGYRLAGAAWLRRRFEKGRDPASRLLREAAELLERLEHGGEYEVLLLVADTAFRRVGLDRRIAVALLEPPEDPVSAQDLRELVYIARAGTRPFRQIAARRLTGTEDPSATAALGQLLFDADSATSDTALAVLMVRQPPSLLRMLSGALRHAPEARDQGMPSIRWGVLEACLARGDEGRLAARAALEEADGDTALVRSLRAHLERV